MRVGAVTRGYFALGSRFSRLPVNFPRYLPRDLADRETAGGGGGGKKKEKWSTAADVLPLWQNANTGDSVSYRPAYETRSYVN